EDEQRRGHHEQTRVTQLAEETHQRGEQQGAHGGIPVWNDVIATSITLARAFVYGANRKLLKNWQPVQVGGGAMRPPHRRVHERPLQEALNEQESDRSCP